MLCPACAQVPALLYIRPALHAPQLAPIYIYIYVQGVHYLKYRPHTGMCSRPCTACTQELAVHAQKPSPYVPKSLHHLHKRFHVCDQNIYIDMHVPVHYLHSLLCPGPMSAVHAYKCPSLCSHLCPLHVYRANMHLICQKQHGITHDLNKCIHSIYLNEHISLYIIIPCHHHVAHAIGAVLCLCPAAYWFTYCSCPGPSVTCDLGPCQ